MRFWTWVVKKINEERSRKDNVKEMPSNLVRGSDDISIEANKSMQFRLYFADGGAVLQTQYYDDRKGDTQRKLFLIDADSNIAERIAAIVQTEIINN